MSYDLLVKLQTETWASRPFFMALITDDELDAALADPTGETREGEAKSERPRRRRAGKGGNGKNVKRKHRQLLQKVREETVAASITTTAEPTDPVDGIQFVLDRAMVMLRHAAAQAELLPANELWRSTQYGPIPHEWIRLEEELRKEVFYMTSKMLHLDIEGRKADAATAMGELIAGVIKGALEEAGVEVTPEVKSAVRNQLAAVAGSGKEVS